MTTETIASTDSASPKPVTSASKNEIDSNSKSTTGTQKKTTLKWGSKTSSKTSMVNINPPSSQPPADTNPKPAIEPHAVSMEKSDSFPTGLNQKNSLPDFEYNEPHYSDNLRCAYTYNFKIHSKTY
jgi:hypothetical protein